MLIIKKKLFMKLDLLKRMCTDFNNKSVLKL